MNTSSINNIIKLEKSLILILILFGVLNAYSQGNPPDAAITSATFVENLGSVGYHEYS